jgi:hypothetical protein
MTDDERLLWGAVANARGNARFEAAHDPLWALVSYATGVGSTFARATCMRFGFNPDSMTRATDRARGVPPATKAPAPVRASQQR